MLRADEKLEEKLNAWAFWWDQKNKPKGWSPPGEQERIDTRYTETSDDLMHYLENRGYRSNTP